MRCPVILVPGTWGLTSGFNWWKPGSEFSNYLRSLGLFVSTDPFSWTTRLDGLGLDNSDWREAGRALRWYARSEFPGEQISVIAHSHGGQVLAYAAAHGLHVNTAITVGTPVRKELQPIYQSLADASKYWAHIYSDEAVGVGWQILGALGIGRLFGIHKREMKHADANLGVKNAGITHAGLMEVDLWRAQGWAQLLT